MIKNKVSVTKISVQWGEMDAFNHVNNVMYIDGVKQLEFPCLEKYGVKRELT